MADKDGTGTAGDAAAIAELSFEDAMAALEEVVSQLERGQVPLEKSIELYQRGARLKAHCEERLKAAEEKVAVLMLDADGTPTGTRPIDDI